jgi:hypothetical protein
MPRPIDLASRIHKLLEEQQQHTDALGRINQMLDQIGSLLGQNGHRRSRKRGRPAAISTMVSSAPTPRRRKRRKFAVSGNDLIMSFVKQNRRPTTKEINSYWMNEGRAGKTDNTLSILVNARKLKRTPLGGGEKGSRYSLA